MKKKMLAAFLSAACLLASVVPFSMVQADGQKVVTLGADLSEDQKNAILRYFGVYGQSIETLTITNTDERAHLGSYVPLEQIGTRTYSCALVKPTSSGGIQVKTANLTWVTSNMIATTLSTSGVVNCDVLAAAPFEVSGTGALTGILMAYESAAGTALDENKKEVATQELVTTTNIANNIGQVNATQIINETKIQVIEGDVINDTDIDIIIEEVAQEQEISLSEEDKALIADLMVKISQLDYNYEDMKQTLERVETNMEEMSAAENNTPVESDAQPDTSAPETDSNAETEAETLDSDSILLNTDDSALGENVVIDATDSSALAETPSETQAEDASENSSDIGFDITTSDAYTAEGGDSGMEGGTDGSSENADASAWDGYSEGNTDISIENPEVPSDQTQDGAVYSDEGSVGEDAIGQDIQTFDGEGSGDITVDGDYSDGSAEGQDAFVEEPAAMPITADEMAFAPVTSEKNGYRTASAGTSVLTVYVEREDIAAGQGTLTVTGQDGSVLETVNMNDTNKVLIQPMDGEELLDQEWGYGMKAVVYLSAPLAQNAQYTASLSENALTSADGLSVSEAASWSIETGSVGIYLNALASDVTPGHTVTAQILMDGTGAVYAEVENVDSSILSFDQTGFDASAATGNVTFIGSGETTFTVSFYGEDGSLIDSVDYTVNIQ